MQFRQGRLLNCGTKQEISEWFSHLAIEVPGENSSNEWLLTQPHRIAPRGLFFVLATLNDCGGQNTRLVI